MTITEILQLHHTAAFNDKGNRECSCGHEFVGEYSGTKHRAHVAEVLEQHIQERERSAWFEGQKAGWDEAKDPGAFVNDLHDAQTTCPY